MMGVNEIRQINSVVIPGRREAASQESIAADRG
jgi:hypothetical protein